MSPEEVERRRRWQDAGHAEARSRGVETVTYLGRTLTILPSVQPITGMSDLLGRAVLEEVRPEDRVLDMGTGCGVNAVLAASRAADVVAVDVNPEAVRCAQDNVAANGLASRIAVVRSDLFERVTGRFDLIIFDPPFRWFPPRDVYEIATTDEQYRSLTRFFAEVDRYLTPGGRVLLFFGTSGDLAYVHELIEAAGMIREAVATRELVRPEMTVHYVTYRLRRGTGTASRRRPGSSPRAS